MISATWRQSATDVLLICGVVTGVGTLWAKIFAGRIGRWLDKRIVAAIAAALAPITKTLGEHTEGIERLGRTVTVARQESSDQHDDVRRRLDEQYAEKSKRIDHLSERIDTLTERIDRSVHRDTGDHR